MAPGQTAFSASKVGCHGLARALPAEHAGRGIRVNIVVHGSIDTPINAAVGDEERALTSLLNGVPMGRMMGSAEEVAALNSWLVSDNASHLAGGYVTVDSGQTCV